MTTNFIFHSKKLKSDYVVLKMATNKERQLMTKSQKTVETCEHKNNVIYNYTKCMKISEKEHDRSTHVAKTKEDFL